MKVKLASLRNKKQTQENDKDPLYIHSIEKVLREIFQQPDVGWTILTFSVEYTVGLKEFSDQHYPRAFPGIQVVATFSDDMVELVRNNASFGTLKIGTENSVHEISGLFSSRMDDGLTETDQSLSMADGIPSSGPCFGTRSSSLRIGDMGVADLCEALRDNTSLVSLSLALSDIGPAGAASLSECLRSNTHLTHLNLGMNQVADQGVEWLLEDWHNKTLYMLNLAENEITTKGAKCVGKFLGNQQSEIRELHLSFNNIKAEGCNAIFEGIMKGHNGIRILSLSTCGIGESMRLAAEMLRRDMKLAQIDFSSNDIGDENCELLCSGLEGNGGLMYLDMSVNALTSKSGEYISKMLKKNENLQFLDLSSNRLQDDGATMILNGIRDLKNRIGEKGMKKLSIVDNDLTPDLIPLLWDMADICMDLRIHSGLEAIINARRATNTSPFPAWTPMPDAIPYA